MIFYIVMYVIFKLFTLEFTFHINSFLFIYFSKCEIFGNISTFYFLEFVFLNSYISVRIISILIYFIYVNNQKIIKIPML